MENLYPYILKRTEFNFGYQFYNFLVKMRILIDILLKVNVTATGLEPTTI